MKRIVIAMVLAAPVGLWADEPPTPKKTTSVDDKLILQILGHINPADELDQVRGVPAKIHAVKLLKSKSYIIDLISTEFDSFLQLTDVAGKMLAQDDDGGGNLNSRIRFTPPADDLYFLHASPLGQGDGSYTLNVRTYEPAPVKITPLPALAAGKPSQFQGVLDQNDPPIEARNRPSKIHTIDLKAGKTYVIDLTSNAFDTYLYLQDAKGTTLAQDDDSGGNLNARIRHRADADGRFRIIATSFNGQVGAYTIRVAEEP